MKQDMKKAPPEFLLIDAGNTRLKWAVAGRKWPGRIAGDIATRDASAAWIKSLALKYPGHPTILACVVPKLAPAFRRAFGRRLVEVNSALRELGGPKPFRFRYPKPQELGADRLAAAVAVHAWGQYPAIIVACGTATAFTVLDEKGRLCGGAIAPGLQTQLAALIGRAAQLPETLLKQPRSALGKSTQEAIRAGVMLNFQGGAKEILAQLRAALESGSRPHIILTGGNAPLLAKNLDVPHTLRPLLILEGLLIIGFRLFGPS
jgi:type III pantothenate kinase